MTFIKTRVGKWNLLCFLELRDQSNFIHSFPFRFKQQLADTVEKINVVRNVFQVSSALKQTPASQLKWRPPLVHGRQKSKELIPFKKVMQLQASNLLMSSVSSMILWMRRWGLEKQKLYKIMSVLLNNWFRSWYTLEKLKWYSAMSPTVRLDLSLFFS